MFSESTNVGIFLRLYCGILCAIVTTRVEIGNGHPLTTDEKLLFDWKNYDDINLDVARYPGEYHIVDCRLNNSNIDVSLLQNDKERFPDNRTLKIGQIFNITKLTIDDEGSYYCNASKRTDKSLGYLYMTPDGKAFQSPKILPKNITVFNIGETVIVDCEIVGWYAMRWYKTNDNEQIPSTDISYSKDFFHITRKQLKIKNITTSEIGEYTCETQRQAVNWKSTDSITIKLNQTAQNTNTMS